MGSVRPLLEPDLHVEEARDRSAPVREVNCATLKGDSAMSALFGHRKGAFTGAADGRVDVATVQAESERLRRLWDGVAGQGAASGDGLGDLLDSEALTALDPFDRVQLAEVVRTCRRARSLSEAGRTLFAASRTRRSTSNDADRLRKYLQRFGLSWGAVAG